ncbi:hypothetical protein LTR85_011113 [Meristemomyces frigidus]|nr:hypothetical protein LTR85_011113 [Meristemomyces frigidus]
MGRPFHNRPHEYIWAFECLASLPSKTPHDYASAARSRYDDFTAAHIVKMLSIHFSGWFLPWHREYHAYLPVKENPLFDGTNTSLSGNGVYVPHKASHITAFGNATLNACLPPGTGGGCVYAGSFTYPAWQQHLRPVSDLAGENGRVSPVPDGLDFNPRCVKRDVNNTLLQMANSHQNITDLIINSSNIRTFHPNLENQTSGPHANGRLAIGGVESDLFSSPGDPIFFMHYSMVDRLWSIWQSLDFESRTLAMDGTTWMATPSVPNVMIEDTLTYSPAFPNTTIRDVMSPTSKHYCYIYV